MLVHTAARQNTGLADGSSVPVAAYSVQDHRDHKSLISFPSLQIWIGLVKD